jgi:hypothetical protein
MVVKMTKEREPVLIDKTTGHVLYAPYFPMITVYRKEEDYKQLMDEHSKAELYVMKNGVSEEDYDEFVRWKNRQSEIFLSNANSVCRVKGICLYDLYQIIKYEDKRDELLSCNSVNYNEWNY